MKKILLLFIISYVFPCLGQVEFTNGGVYSWTVPEGVASISIVVIGAGGGSVSGGASSFSYNGIPIIEAYGGGQSAGFSGGGAGGQGTEIGLVIDEGIVGGGNGGNGGLGAGLNAYGGGAGGYDSNGVNGISIGACAQNGQGVSIYGGDGLVAGNYGYGQGYCNGGASGGGGGGGLRYLTSYNVEVGQQYTIHVGDGYTTCNENYGCYGSGAVRIIWGDGRSYPNTNTQDQFEETCYGCLDETACNYNEFAEIDDGSCEYFDCNGECGGISIIDDCGVCSGDGTSCYGCIDENAVNFNQQENGENCYFIDDYSNLIEECIYGSNNCNYNPNILSVYDVPEDQGGFVFINWAPMSLDVLPNEIILYYSIFRHIPNNRGWELLDEIPANYFNDYSYTAPTIQTSIPSEELLYETEYLVRAHTELQYVFYDSEVVTGYSIDNIFPETPSNLSATIENEKFILSWSEPIYDDFSYFTLFIDDNESINLYNTLYENNDSINNHSYYLQSTDINGNISDSSNILYFNKGNLNFDSSINVIDVIVLIDIIIEILEHNYTPTETEVYLSDFYEDGQLNVIDIVGLVNIILEQ